MNKISPSLILATIVFAKSYSAEHITTKKKKVLELFVIKNILTEIQSPLATTSKKQTEHGPFGLFISAIYLDEPSKSLINLWSQQFDTREFNLRFCPTIIRYEGKGSFLNLGSLDSIKHEEAKEACRIGHGVYFSCQQGAIIYNPKCRIKCEDDCWKDIIHQKINIQKMIIDNQNRPIELLQ